MLKTVLAKHQLKFTFTLVLVLTEALLSLLFPLVIGFSIDDAMNQSSKGALLLGLLGLVTLVVGVGRRMFDSRFYAKVFQELGQVTVSKLRDTTVSLRSARLGMLRELVEFLENTLPELITATVGVVGLVIIIAGLNIDVFYGVLLVSIVLFMIYGLSSKRTIHLNKAANDEQEFQVDVLSDTHEKSLKDHLQQLMRWNVKLSDLEAVNFSISWIVLMVFLVITILISVKNTTQYGALFALVMYVFQYIESVINLPFYYQNWLRLREIKERF